MGTPTQNARSVKAHHWSWQKKALVATLIALVLTLACIVGFVAYASKGYPLRYLESLVSTLMLPTELQKAAFLSSLDSGGYLYQVSAGGFRPVAFNVTSASKNGNHITVSAGGFQKSKIYEDGVLIATSTGLLVTPVLNADDSIISWGEILTPHKLSAFSDERIVVRDKNVIGAQHIYAGVAPFFTPDGDLGRIVNEGVALTDSAGGTRIVAVPAGTVFTPAAIYTPSFVASPNGAYVGWVTTEGVLVVMRVNGNQLEPVISQQTQSKYLTLSNDAFYVITLRHGKSIIERTVFDDKSISRFFLPSFFKFSSIIL